ncbi:ferrous iron transport protein A [bacterium SCSIO 12741]|nr:ferrous iron transport protein A [bacterium SCSIO 12741]
MKKDSFHYNLANAPQQKMLRVTRIEDSELAIKLLEFGLGQNRHCRVIRKAPFKGPLMIQCDRYQFVIRREEAQLVQVDFE